MFKPPMFVTFTLFFGAGYRIRIDTVLLPRDFKSRVSTCSTNPAYMAGVAGLEPAECRSQSPVPYRLGDTPI